MAFLPSRALARGNVHEIDGQLVPVDATHVRVEIDRRGLPDTPVDVVEVLVDSSPDGQVWTRLGSFRACGGDVFDPATNATAVTSWIVLELPRDAKYTRSRVVALVDRVTVDLTRATIAGEHTPHIPQDHNSVVFGATSGAQAGTTTALSWTHTTSGSNRGLIVFALPWATTASSATYNSVGMTSAGTVAGPSSDGHRAYAYYLAAPASGANTVTINCPSGTMAGAAISATSVDQTTPVGGYATATGTTTAISVAISGGATGALAVGASSFWYSAPSVTPSGGWTTRELSDGATARYSASHTMSGTTDTYAATLGTAASHADVALFFKESSGAISGTATVTFGQSGALTGAGALAGSTAVTFGQSGNIKGAGALAGTAATVFGQSGALTGSGAMVASAAVTFGQSGALTGAGALSGSSAWSFGQSGALVGSGALAGNTAWAFGQSGALTGSGALAGSSAWTFGQSGTLTNLTAGAISGTASMTFAQSATLAGAGALAGSSAVVFGQSGALTGAGALSGTSALTFGQSGALTGAGALIGSTAWTFSQSGAITGSGALSGSSALTFGQSGTLTGSSPGAMSGSAAMTFGQSGALTGVGALAGTTALTFGGSLLIPAADVGSGGWPTADEYRRYRRLVERQRKIAEERPEKQDRAVPVEAVRTIAKAVKRDYAALASMAEEARIERLRKEIEAADLQYRAVYEQFLRAELMRFREEEAVMMLMLISATVH